MKKKKLGNLEYIPQGQMQKPRTGETNTHTPKTKKRQKSNQIL
jgi:hypothetical protein